MNKEDMSEIVDLFIDVLCDAGDENENEVKAAFEWKKLGVEHKIKTLGIMAHYSGHHKWLSIYKAVSIIHSKVMKQDEGVSDDTH